MLFPDKALSDYGKSDLAEALKSQPLVRADPLPCDRWIARSALQKAIRRGDKNFCVRALARLMTDDRSAVWRHLIVIGLEDVGTANPELLAQLIAAKRDRLWRKSIGDDWCVLSGLARLMASSKHCQANCDLLLNVQNDPSLRRAKLECLDADWGTLAYAIEDGSRPLAHRAIAALALGGNLFSDHAISDVAGLFEIFSELGHSGHLVATCQDAWKISRNPMAMLMPLIWQSQFAVQISEIDDPMPAFAEIGGVPEYALDQFTRIGNTVSRRYLKADNVLQSYFDIASLPSSERSRAIGDIIFLLEGGLAVGRLTWPEAECLRKPYRWLPVVGKLGPHLPKILAHCQAKASQIALHRRRLYPSNADLKA